MTKIYTITSDESYIFEKYVNNRLMLLEKSGAVIIDVKFSHSISHANATKYHSYSAMILYKQDDE